MGASLALRPPNLLKQVKENQMVPTRYTGQIKFIATEKGFGFIESDFGEDFYFNISELKGYISPGDRVSFQAVPARRGPKAIKITLYNND